MSHIMPASSGDTNPEISLSRFGATDRELLAAVFEHETVNIFIHLDDCEDGACTGCDPQHLAEKAAECESADLKSRVTRAIHALKSPEPDGSQHYRSGWDDGVDAAIDAARDALDGGEFRG